MECLNKLSVHLVVRLSHYQMHWQLITAFQRVANSTSDFYFRAGMNIHFWMFIGPKIFFDGSSGSHPRTKLSGSRFLIDHMFLIKYWSLCLVKCTESLLMWNQLTIPAVLKHVVSLSRSLCMGPVFCILPRMNKSMALFHITIFLCHAFCIPFQKNFSIWVTSGSYVYAWAHLDYSVSQWVKWVNRCDPLSTLVTTQATHTFPDMPGHHLYIMVNAFMPACDTINYYIKRQLKKHYTYILIKTKCKMQAYTYIPIIVAVNYYS